MRLLWLADVLRAAGLAVHEYEGWRTRGASTFGPVSGIVCHGTAGSLTSTDAGELRTIAITGSNTATPPIAQLYLSRTGTVWVVASGTATGVLAGTAGPLKGLSDDAVLQIEAQHHPTEPWADVQYRAYVRLVAALVAYREPGYEVTVDRVVGHSEHQPGQKTDPWLDMGKLRADVRTILEGDDDIMGLAAEQITWEIRPWLIHVYQTVDALALTVAEIAKRVDIDPAELDAIKASAAAGARQGVAETVTAETIAAAIPDDIAAEVVDLLAARLRPAPSV